MHFVDDFARQTVMESGAMLRAIVVSSDPESNLEVLKCGRQAVSIEPQVGSA